jgi:hypothetical protein
VAFTPVAHAQSSDEGALILGPLTLRPSLVLRDTGTDSNIFNEPDVLGPKDDVTAVFSPAADGRLQLGLLRVTMSGGTDFQYFRRFADERYINRAVAVRIEPQFSRARPFASVSYRNTRNRETSEIDLRVVRIESAYAAGVIVPLFSRSSLEVGARRGERRHGDGVLVRGVNLAETLDRDEESANLRFVHELSPLTSFFADGVIQRDSFIDSPALSNESREVNGGFLFAPDAVIRGRASLGYRQMRPRGPDAAAFDGLVASVDLSYSLLNRTTFTGRFVRGTNYSIEQEPFYLSTLASLEVAHNLVGPVDLIARAVRENLDYDALPLLSSVAGVDRATTVGGGVAVRVSSRSQVSVNYDETRRQSERLAEIDYNRQRLYTTISYGF